MKAFGNFKNDWKTQKLSKTIAQFHNRGFATAEKVQTVLNDLKETGITHLKNLDEQKVEELAKEYAERVENGELAAKTAATYISALNQIIDYSNHFFNNDIEQIKYSDFDIHKETDYRDKSISEETHNNFQSFLEEKYQETGDIRFQALEYATELQREFGLRFRESAGLNINTIENALETGKLELGRDDWTKNAREREIEIRTEEQRGLLEEVKDFMEKNNAVNLAGAEDSKSFSEIAEFRSFADYQRNEFNNIFGEDFNFHGERHAWAQEMYSSLWEEKTGVAIESPIEYYSEQLEQAGWDFEGKFYDAVQEYEIPSWFDYVQEQLPEWDPADIKELDSEIRMEISEELGHNRLDITNTYLGHP